MEPGDQRPLAGGRRPEAEGWSPDAGGRMPEAGGRRPEARGRKSERRPETGGRRPEAGGRRPESGGGPEARGSIFKRTHFPTVFECCAHLKLMDFVGRALKSTMPESVGIHQAAVPP